MLHVEGRLLCVDVTARTGERVDVDGTLEAFVGGRGVATKLAHDRIPFDAAPLGPENRLYFTMGPMQLSDTSFTGRMNCTGVSPLTDGLLSSNAGGFLSRNFAATGFAGVEIVGESDDLLALHVTDDGVEFEPVPGLREATVPEVDRYMEREHDLEPANLAVVGPAGENLVRYASVMTSETRAFGRGGLGAVLGAKNVKAVSFGGDASPDVDVPDVQSDIHRQAAQSDSVMKRQGTTSVTDLANVKGALPTRYFSETSFDGAEGINGDAVESKKYKKGTCSKCAFACKLPTRDDETGLETEGPEYETVMAFGSNAAVDDIVDVMRANDLCDRFGLDTISTGDTIAAYLSAHDEFGNVDLIHDLVERIAYRDGVGDLLAEGVDRIHDELGVDNWTVKGMEFSAHDGRTLNGQGLAFATANRGADHMYSSFYELEYPLVEPSEAVVADGLDGKPERLVEKENWNGFMDSAILCKFSRNVDAKALVAELFDAPFEDLLAVGQRVVDLERHFNNRRGFDRDDDTLPYEIAGFDAALDAYYEQRGWRPDGTVPRERVSG